MVVLNTYNGKQHVKIALSSTLDPFCRYCSRMTPVIVTRIGRAWEAQIVYPYTTRPYEVSRRHIAAGRIWLGGNRRCAKNIFIKSLTLDGLREKLAANTLYLDAETYDMLRGLR